MRWAMKAAVAGIATLLVVGFAGQRPAPAGETAGQATIISPPQEPVDPIMGLYEGKFTPAGGRPAAKADAKVIGMNLMPDKKVTVHLAVVGTLPGQAGEQPVAVRLRGNFGGGEAVTTTVKGVEWSGRIEKDNVVVEGKGEQGGKFELRKVAPRSPTEGDKPPANAEVLLPFTPGKPTNLDQWRNKRWPLVDDGSMMAGGGNNLTVKEFGDMRLHLEFRVPYMPEASGQGRGNSGVYSQDRYEVQILDSFGLTPRDNECGGIYEVAPPKVNACFPPGTWQTYDITFRTHRFDANGKVIEPAKLTVYHNGVLIHENQPVMNATRAAGSSGPVKKGPLMLQDHGNPVRYRNIWLVELKGE